MSGVFNTIDHETESLSRSASSELLEGVSSVFRMMSEAEQQSPDGIERRRQQAKRHLVLSAALFDQIKAQSSDYSLSPPAASPGADEYAELLARLQNFGLFAPLTNYRLPEFAAAEIRRFQTEVASAEFPGTRADWIGMPSTELSPASIASSPQALASQDSRLLRPIGSDFQGREALGVRRVTARRRKPLASPNWLGWHLWRP